MQPTQQFNLALVATTTLALAHAAIAAVTARDGAGGNCINLGGDKDYTWKADGAFSGSGQIDDQEHCFGSGGGGISIGAPGAPMGTPGNTRLECFFPETETDAEFYNCNLSLVDGFSAAVTCTTANSGGWPNSNNDSAPLGCGYDLMDGCENYDDTCKCCKNSNGAKVSDAAAVAPNFQSCKDSDEYPNSAEIYFDMPGAFKFSKSDFPLSCEVGKGAKVGGSQKRSAAPSQSEQQHAHAHAHGGTHHKRAPIHQKRLAQILS